MTISNPRCNKIEDSTNPTDAMSVTLARDGTQQILQSLTWGHRLACPHGDIAGTFTFPLRDVRIVNCLLPNLRYRQLASQQAVRNNKRASSIQVTDLERKFNTNIPAQLSSSRSWTFHHTSHLIPHTSVHPPGNSQSLSVTVQVPGPQHNCRSSPRPSTPTQPASLAAQGNGME